MLGEGAGRSFNQTVGSQGAVLETVVRVSRTGGSKTREVRGNGNAPAGPGSGPAGHNLTTFQDGAISRPESFFERIGSTAKDIDRALGGKEEEDDVERLVDSSDNEFVISNPAGPPHPTAHWSPKLTQFAA